MTDGIAFLAKLEIFKWPRLVTSPTICHPLLNIAPAPMTAAPDAHNTRGRRSVYTKLRGGHSVPARSS